MLFEVWKNGECKMATDYISCIYSDNILRSMSKAGYTFKFKGKRISLNALLKEKEEVT